MRSSRMVRAPDCQCHAKYCNNSPGFDPSILRHSGIRGVADEAVLNKILYKSKKLSLKIYLCIKHCAVYQQNTNVDNNANVKNFYLSFFYTSIEED